MGLVSKDEFIKLSINAKGDLVFNNGKHIAIRYYYNFTINLYLYNDYFVEIWYFPVENKIEKIELLEKEKTLDLYIDYMNKLDEK